MKIINWCGVKLDACDDGAEWFLAQKDHSLVAIVKAAIAGGRETMGYANWGIVRKKISRYKKIKAWAYVDRGTVVWTQRIKGQGYNTPCTITIKKSDIGGE